MDKSYYPLVYINSQVRSKRSVEHLLREIEVQLEEILEDRDTPGIADLKHGLYHVWCTLLWVIHDNWKDRPEVLSLGPYQFVLDKKNENDYGSLTHKLKVYKTDQDGNKRELFIF